MISFIKKKEVIKKKEEVFLYDIFNKNYKSFDFFEYYGFAVYNYTNMYENPNFVAITKDYYRDPIKLRKGMKINKKYKKRNYKKQKKAWLPISWKYHRSKFTTQGCLLYDTDLINANKIKLLNFFFKWQKKRNRAYRLTKIQKEDDYINEGDQLIISFYCFKASFKKIVSNLEKNDVILTDYERIRRIVHPINFKFMFYDLHKNNQDLMFDFSGSGYDDCTLLIICNSYYIQYFEDFQSLLDIAIDWYLQLVTLRDFNLCWNLYMWKYDFLFEYWKAFKINYWFRKYWDPEWPKIIGEIWSKIKFQRREDIINTKRKEKNVSREEAIKLVYEDKMRARAENIILKAQMKEKLKTLDWFESLRWTRDLIADYKKKGIDISFGDALELIRLRRIEYAKNTAETIAINKKIAKEMLLEEKRNFQPKMRDIRIFKNLKRR